MAILKASDVLCGGEGRAYAQIGDKIEELIYVKSVEARIKRKKVSFSVLGSRGEISRPAGWQGTGTMMAYYVTSFFREMLGEYNKTGRDVYFDLHIINESKGDVDKRQIVVLKNVNVDGMILAKLDVDSAVLEEELSFTFENFEVFEAFAKMN